MSACACDGGSPDAPGQKAVPVSVPRAETLLCLLALHPGRDPKFQTPRKHACMHAAMSCSIALCLPTAMDHGMVVVKQHEVKMLLVCLGEVI